MAIIYKYPIYHATVQTVRNGNIIHFAKDGNGQMCAWIAHYDDDQTMTNLYLMGTGFEFSEYHIVHGSLVDEWGNVWHLIEEWNPDA